MAIVSLKMKPETIAVHGGYDSDPTTKAVAVPIYQTVAYSFDSAAHGAALFNLETPGYRYTRIANPTTDVLERRSRTARGGGRRALREFGAGGPVLRSAHHTEMGRNIVSVPQLYGTTHTLFAHVLPQFGITTRLPGRTNRRRWQRSLTRTPVPYFANPSATRRKCLRPGGHRAGRTPRRGAADRR